SGSVRSQRARRHERAPMGSKTPEGRERSASQPETRRSRPRLDEMAVRRPLALRSQRGSGRDRVVWNRFGIGLRGATPRLVTEDLDCEKARQKLVSPCNTATPEAQHCNTESATR